MRPAAALSLSSARRRARPPRIIRPRSTIAARCASSRASSSRFAGATPTSCSSCAPQAPPEQRRIGSSRVYRSLCSKEPGSQAVCSPSAIGQRVKVAGWPSRTRASMLVSNVLLPSGDEALFYPQSKLRWSTRQAGGQWARESVSGEQRDLFRVWSVADLGAYIRMAQAIAVKLTPAAQAKMAHPASARRLSAARHAGDHAQPTADTVRRSRRPHRPRARVVRRATQDRHGRAA